MRIRRVVFTAAAVDHHLVMGAVVIYLTTLLARLVSLHVVGRKS